MLCRKVQADHLARQAHPPKTQLAAWRQGGKHLPVAGTIRLQAFQKLNRPSRPARGWDHWLAQRCNDRCLTLRHLVHHHLHQMQTLDALDQMLTEQAAVAFPPVAKPQLFGVWAMWQAYRNWKRTTRRDLRSVLKAWRGCHLFRQKQRAFKQAGKEARKHWFRSRLSDLQDAAQSKDTRLLHAEIRSLAPRRKRVAVQLRDAQGCRAATCLIDRLCPPRQRVFPSR